MDLLLHVDLGFHDLFPPDCRSGHHGLGSRREPGFDQRAVTDFPQAGLRLGREPKVFQDPQTNHGICKQPK